MDAAWLRQALQRAGASQADLGRHLGLPASAISRMTSGERQVKAIEVPHIAAFLGVPQEEVLRHALTDRATTGEPGRRGRPPRTASSAPPPPPPGGDLVPIRSGARGGSNQPMFLADGPIGYTPRPANLDGVRDAYAIYMTGDSMEPRYIQGWLLHVNPFKPPVRGRDVVVYKSNDEVLIKQFVGWQGDQLVLHQLNPDETFRIPRTEIVECHLIVGVDQEG